MLINLQKKIPGKTLIYDLKIILETGIFTGCNSRKWGHRNLAKIRTVGRYENLFDKFQFYHDFGGQNYFSEIFINLLSFLSNLPGLVKVAYKNIILCWQHLSFGLVQWTTERLY